MSKREKHPGAPGPPYCCELKCERDAEWIIYDLEDRTPDGGQTHACTEHVGNMLGHGPGVEAAAPFRFEVVAL